MFEMEFAERLHKLESEIKYLKRIETSGGGGGITLDDVYPVGSVYISVDSTSPATLFGGTWVEFGAGKVMVGRDASDADFDTAEETGGEKTHTLTVTEMPSHNHSVAASHRHTVGVGTGADTSAARAGGPQSTTFYSGYASITINSTGGDGAHNNLQPYIVVYMWKRTA